MTNYRVAFLLALMLTAFSALSTALRAQTPARDLIASARAAIDDFEIERAGGLLRRALDPETPALPGEHLRALVLLTVVELRANRPDSAGRAAQEALTIDPQHRVDSLDFLDAALVNTFAVARAAMAARAPARATLEIRGVPPDARVEVDGVAWLTLRREVNPGLRRIQIEARGYTPLADSVLVDTGATVIRDVTLRRALEARLSVNTYPWTLVYLGDERLGETPIFDMPVPAGRYTLRLESPLISHAVERRVELPSNRHTQLGTIGLDSLPPLTPEIARPESLYREMELDSALAAYRAVGTQAASGSAGELVAMAMTRAAMINYAIATGRNDAARLDSANSYFREAYRLAPRYSPPSAELAPDLRAFMESARADVLFFTVDLPADTVVPAYRGHLRFVGRPTHAAQVSWAVTEAGGDQVLRSDSQIVDGVGSFEWDLRNPDGSLVSPGQYRLRVAARDSLGEAAPVLVRNLLIERLGVDTMPTPPALPSGAFLPESTVRGPGSPGALVLGLVFAGATVGLPIALGHPAFNPSQSPEIESYVVAGVTGLAGIVSFAVGKRLRPHAGNISRNRQTREEDARRRASIAQMNAEARANAPIRVRVQEGSP